MTGARLDPADAAGAAELQFACPACGTGLPVAVGTRPDGARPDGARAAVVPAACAEGHRLTDDQRRTVAAGALRIVGARAGAAARGEAAPG
jgi:hypothetical protein